MQRYLLATSGHEDGDAVYYLDKPFPIIILENFIQPGIVALRLSWQTERLLATGDLATAVGEWRLGAENQRDGHHSMPRRRLIDIGEGAKS